MLKEIKLAEVNSNVRLRQTYTKGSQKTSVKGIRVCPDGTYCARVIVRGVVWGAEGFRTFEGAFTAREKAKKEMEAQFASMDNTAQVKHHEVSTAAGRKSSKVWYVRSPQGEKIEIRNMQRGAEENVELFGKEPTYHGAHAIAHQFYILKRIYLGDAKSYHGLFDTIDYQGWSLDGWEDLFGLCSTYGPPLRGDLFITEKTARDAYKAQTREEQKVQRREKSFAILHEKYLREKEKLGRSPRAITGYYPEFMGYNHKSLPSHAKPVELHAPDGEIIPCR